MNSRYYNYLTFKSTFQSEKPKKLEKTSLNVKFLVGIICILLHRPKKLTLVKLLVSVLVASPLSFQNKGLFPIVLTRLLDVRTPNNYWRPSVFTILNPIIKPD